MKKKSLSISLQKAIAYLYFFFNSVGLRGGLLYTNLLTPFLLIWIYKKHQIKPLIYSLLIIFPFSIIHVFLGVNFKSFIVSHLLVISTIIFVISAYVYISKYASLKNTIQKILTYNFIFVLIAIPFYFLEYKYQKIFWYTNLFTTQNAFTRLSLMTFEASYYSLLLIPIAYYYIYKIVFSDNIQNKKLLILMIVLPFILSLSFGVIGGCLITAFFMIWFNRHKFQKHKKLLNLLSACIILTIISFIFLYVFFPNSLPAKRISNVFLGYDTSTRGRTIEAFKIAWLVAKSKSIWFGCGLGQTKFILPEIIQQHFPYWGKLDVYRIPNTLAETFAIFGIFGVLIRFIIIFYFFVKTRVNKNYFRLSLFIFIFIYQFTGSYITNIVEYVIWVFAFTDIFPEFNINQSYRKNLENVE